MAKAVNKDPAKEARIQALGAALLKRAQGAQPSLFNKAWWQGQVMAWSMKEPDFKTEMFRFVDVFPSLESPEEIHKHLEEYLLRPGLEVPTFIRALLKGAKLGGLLRRASAKQIEKNMGSMARTLIAGESGEDALEQLTALRKQGQAFTVDLLGEETVSEEEAESYLQTCHQLLEKLCDAAEKWSPVERLDQDDRGSIPRVNVSVKLI